ncbi:MAG TPA: helix-turn-helix transcriptional regulator [Puia sp.]|nr:helix-turn-helix transcriptional regulator [Puia sp.]
MSVRKKLQQLSKGKVSGWSKEAEFRLKNAKWLRYSSNVARRLYSAIEDSGKNQSDIAKETEVSPQYISKVLKGEENLTLETIAKLSTAVGTELISFPAYKYGGVVQMPIYASVLPQAKLHQIFMSGSIMGEKHDLHFPFAGFYSICAPAVTFPMCTVGASLETSDMQTFRPIVWRKKSPALHSQKQNAG